MEFQIIPCWKHDCTATFTTLNERTTHSLFAHEVPLPSLGVGERDLRPPATPYHPPNWKAQVAQAVMRNGVVAMLCFVLCSAWCSALGAEPLPESVLLYELLQPQLPRVQVDGVPLGGLSLCKLLERRYQPQPFFALPRDLGQDTCDLRRVICAYGCFCTAGVEDSTGPHFSQPMLPSVEIVTYDEGWTVIFLNHYLKAHVKRTAVGAEAAAAFFRQLPEHLDVRAAGVALFPAEYVGHLPPHKEP